MEQEGYTGGGGGGGGGQDEVSQCRSAVSMEMRDSDWKAKGLIVAWTSHHEGELMKVMGCPLVEVQYTLLLR